MQQDVIEAVSAGSATVSAASADIVGQIPVSVVEVPASIGLIPQRIDFRALSDTATIRATVLDSLGSPIEDSTVVWASGDSSVATVDGGLVTSVADGATTISVSPCRILLRR